MTDYQPQVTTQTRDEDLTVRDLILAFRRYRNEALRMWWLYLVCFLLIGGYLLYRAWSAPVTYEARLTFMVNEEEGGGFGGMSSVLGQLGLGRARAGSRYNLDKIVELAKSRKIIQQVLLSPPVDDPEKGFIGNALIEEYKLDEKWAENDSSMQGFRFTHDSVPVFNEQERKALLALHGKCVGGEKQEGLTNASYNDLSGILSLTCKTTNEELSVDIARLHFAKLGQFYIDQAIERQQKTYDLVRAKVDSIAGELSGVDVSLAVYTDASNNLFSRVDQVKGTRLQRDIIKLSTMQAEAVKNMEYAEFMLKNSRPVIQELDIPISPLQGTKPSLKKAFLIGALVAFVVASILIVGRMVVRDAMK